MSETVVRRWLRENWPGEVRWVEPARGGSVGLGDAVVDVCGQDVELELKWGAFNAKGFKLDFRPAQRRHHFMKAREGGKSALLIGYKVNQRFCLGVAPGRMVPMEPYGLRAAELWAIPSGEALKQILAEKDVQFW